MPRLTLQSVETNAGFLENAKITFGDGLNCIIGARGTCKSTVVESIRFAFDLDADAIARITKPRDKVTGKDEGIVRATLGPGSVTCVIQSAANGTSTRYSIKRELDRPPRVQRDTGPDSIPAEVLGEIEIYSQGDLQLIASENQNDRRLALLDRAHRSRVLMLTSEKEKATDELRTLGTQLRQIQSEGDIRRIHVRDAPNVRAELVQVREGRPEMPASLEQQHNDYLKRERILEIALELQEIQTSVSEALARAKATEGAVTGVAERLRSLDPHDITNMLPLMERLVGTIRAIGDVQSAVDTVPVLEFRNALLPKFEEQNEAYYRQRQQEQTVSESLKREEVLRRRIEEIDRYARELAALDAQRNSLVERRKQLRARLLAIRDEIFELRVAEATRINAEFGDVILLTVKRAAYSSTYVNKISELIAGSRVRSREDIAEELATNFLPNDLLDIIEAGDAQRVASLLGRDLGQITRVVTYLRDNASLYDLEGAWGDDTLEITMFDNGVPKQVEQLSRGQRATALLPLILRGATSPLIIDQPEDDLDNSFIFQALVKNITALKAQRQLIFVTHNANIPVLGEADVVIVMEMETPTKAKRPRVGNLEDRKQDVLDLLEGGKEAFEQREHHYHDLLQ